jgi:prepilin-type N-terminal cleavage/methylation domain-containing protein
MQTILRRRPQRGVTLIEALVALVVMSLGMLAFAGLHARLRLNSDVARERAEAVRLAQLDMENLRAYADLPTFDAFAANTTGTTVGATTTFAINRTIDTSDDSMTQLRVAYGWNDRAGQAQQVVVRSTVARSDPKLSAMMALPPNGSPVKDPLGRDVQIPIPAKNLGDGTSVFKPNQGQGLAFVFSNESGLVTRRCTTVSQTTGQIGVANVAAGTNGCVDLASPAYLLSGYIRFDLSNNPSASNPNNAPPNGGTASIAIKMDDTVITTGAPLGTLNRLNTTYWTGLSAGVGASYTAPECGAEDSKTITYSQLVNYSQTSTNPDGTTSTTTQANAQVVLIVPASTALTAAAIQPYTTLSASASDLAKITNVQDGGERYIGYACVVYPKDLNGAKAWSGRSTLVPSGWTLGTGTGAYKVCRYSADSDLDGSIWLPTQVGGTDITPTSSPNTVMTKIDNAEHPNGYIWVTSSLSNQNFLVINGNRNCPTDGAFEVNGQGSENYTDETTVLHQP